MVDDLAAAVGAAHAAAAAASARLRRRHSATRPTGAAALHGLVAHDARRRWHTDADAAADAQHAGGGRGGDASLLVCVPLLVVVVPATRRLLPACLFVVLFLVLVRYTERKLGKGGRMWSVERVWGCPVVRTVVRTVRACFFYMSSLAHCRPKASRRERLRKTNVKRSQNRRRCTFELFGVSLGMFRMLRVVF